MTTPAKVNANRCDALLAARLRTVPGKGVVARNATRHGVFAHLPVVSGESPHEWNEHLAGVVASLTPIGLLEVSLAERAALILWRLARLARFEMGTTSAAVEDAGLLRPETDPCIASLQPPGLNTDNYLKMTQNHLRAARVNLAELRAEADLARRLDEMGESESCPTEVVLGLLGWAHGEAYEYPFRIADPVHHTDPDYCSKLGLPGSKAREVAWTPALVIRAIERLAGPTRKSPTVFRAHIREAIEGRVAALEREVRRLEADAEAIVRRDEGSRARASDASLLPPEPIAERVMKYEKQLHGQLTSTLRELERLQIRRSGAWSALPVVAGVQVVFTTGLE